jgi:hypothetical protein
LKGEGNSYDFGERLYDPRIGRWSSTDNVEKPWLSPYQFADNNPANNVDSDGNDEIHFFYKTQQMLDKEGKAYTQLTLSSEIIKNDLEHTFYMHSPQGATVEFHPFRSDRTPNEHSTEAYDNKLPLSKGVSWFDVGVDDHAYLGALLQAAPEVLEHYSDIREDGMRFQGAVNRASSVDFAEKMITATETAYAIADGYYLVRGLSKFVVKNLAKNTAKVAGNTADNITIVKIDKVKYPEAAKHIEEAKAAGHPDILTVDREGAKANRRKSLKGTNTKPKLDRDEYPPAMFKEGGTGASVKHINPSQNRGAGKSMGHQLKDVPKGGKVKIITK